MLIERQHAFVKKRRKKKKENIKMQYFILDSVVVLWDT